MNSKRLLLGAAIVAVLLGGCDRNLDTPYDPDLDIVPPPVPSALTAHVADRQIQLAWSISDPGNVARYLIHRSDTTASNFELYDSSTTTSYTDNSVINGITYFYKVSARDLNGVEGTQSKAISASSQPFAIRINDDSLYTKSLIVRVALTATNAALMRVTDDTTAPGTWEPFSSVKNYTLKGSAGTKRVFAQIRAQSGVETAGWLSDSIIYDDRAAISVVNVTDSVLAPGDSMIIAVHCGEPNGTASCSLGVRRNIPMYDDGTGADTVANDGIYTGVYLATSDDLFEDQPLYARFTDRAGNVATSITADWRISVRRPPTPPAWISIDGVQDDPHTLKLSWSVGSITPFSHFLIRRSTTSGLGTSAPIIKSETSLAKTTFTDTGLAASTWYHYTVEVVLENGLSAISAEDSGLTTVDLPPDSVTLLPPSELKFNKVTLEWTTSGARDFSAYRLHRSQSTPVTESAPLIFGTAQSGTTSFTDTMVTGSSVYYYRVFVVDRAGQSTGSNTLNVATPADLPPAAVTVANSATADSTVKLVWSPSTDEDFASYRVYRATSQPPLLALPSDSLLVDILTDRNSTEHEETGLAQVYYYRVFVFDRGGLSTGSNIVSGP